MEAYLKAVSGSFILSIRFAGSLNPGPAYPNPKRFAGYSRTIIWRCFNGHTQRFLWDEVEWFKTKSEAQVQDWERRLQEQENSTEQFFFSNVSRQAAKQDFLSSFKNMLMLPVNAVSSLGGTSKKTATSSIAESGSNRTSTPTPFQTTSPVSSSFPSGGPGDGSVGSHWVGNSDCNRCLRIDG